MIIISPLLSWGGALWGSHPFVFLFLATQFLSAGGLIAYFTLTKQWRTFFYVLFNLGKVAVTIQWVLAFSSKVSENDKHPLKEDGRGSLLEDRRKQISQNLSDPITDITPKSSKRGVFKRRTIAITKSNSDGSLTGTSS